MDVIFRLSYLTFNAHHMIVAEEHREGINEDRVPEGYIRVKVIPGEDYFLQGEDADEFRRQLDEKFPRPSREPKPPRSVIIGRQVDPETGESLVPPGNSILEG